MLSGGASGLFGLGGQNANPPNQLGQYNIQRQIYMDKLMNRVGEIDNILTDKIASLFCFTYEIDTENAAMKNAKIEMFFKENAKNNNSQNKEIEEILAKFLKAKEANPNPNICAIVSIRGINGLVERMTAASAAHKKILEGFAQIDDVNKILYANCTKLQSQLQNIKVRHGSLSHQFLRVVNLIEESCILSENVEPNTYAQLTNNQILSKIDELYNWGRWQSRLNALKYQMESLSSSFSSTALASPLLSSFSFTPNLDVFDVDESRPTDILDKSQETAIFEILNQSSATIDSHRQSFDKLERRVVQMEEKLKATSKK